MKNHWIISIRVTLATLILFGVVYPLVVTGIAWLTGPNHGKGKMELIGQSFKSDKYFNGRPSAVSYNAAAAGGSNKGPSNQEYLAQVEQRINDFLAHNPKVKRADIPVDLVTASGSGLDPHISVKAATIQIERIAAVRGISVAAIQKIIEDNTERPLLGPTCVSVLKLNIVLDQVKK
jgi:K+-transporting ATPase ATPase C chain